MILQFVYSLGLGSLAFIIAGLFYNVLLSKPNPPLGLKATFFLALMVFFWVLGFFIKLMVAEVARSLM